ncbi:MAG: 6-carboxytetrahydropterin synthase [Candidatus Coprenecus sp.]|nr:6-carboxytetrahydropterin synthase [Candidatus Coprenecus sp.]
MIIRKLFKFEASHIVRNCYSERCRKNVHGHSFILELFLQSYTLDRAGMVLDFGLLKEDVKSFVDCLDHCHFLWSKEETLLNETIKKVNDRWIEFPFNPTSENIALYIHTTIETILSKRENMNSEDCVKVKSVRLHETQSGYAETENGEPLLSTMRDYSRDIVFSPTIMGLLPPSIYPTTVCQDTL